MSTTIHDILDELRASALDERDKGEKFERLMQGYFRTDPEWSLQFSDVWLWSEWPGRDGRPDTGIDLVAASRETGELTAIQCKFYAPHHSVQKADIDSFFTASGKIGFTRRIIVSTSDKWSKNAEEALTGQQVPTQRLDISTLSESVVDWSEYSLATPSVMPTRGPKKLRKHQQKALDTVIEKFGDHDRGQLWCPTQRRSPLPQWFYREWHGAELQASASATVTGDLPTRACSAVYFSPDSLTVQERGNYA